MRRATIGYVLGARGRFGRLPFYSVSLDLSQCKRLDQLLGQSNAQARRTVTVTATFHQPNRLRITEFDAPDYEVRSATQYVRGDVIRVHGKEGVSCGLNISAKFGVPLIREQLAGAMAKAREYLEFRVPSRKRDVIEFVPDSDFRQLTCVDDADLLAEASIWAAARVLPPEDFSDWEKS